MSYAERSGRHEPGEEGADRQVDVRAVVEQQDGGVECTLYPNDADRVALMSRWITAGEGSFVALSEMR